MSDNPTTPAVRCVDVRKSFGSDSVVRGLNLSVAPGEILALLGPSGCGKTTALRLIAGFELPDSGLIEIAGRTVADKRRSIPPEQRRIGYVFQDYAIFPHLSVAQNVAFGLGKEQRRSQRVSELLSFVGLDGQGDKMPDQLSGGQQQRVALARSLAPQPDVLLLDEPFSNLDAGLRSGMRHEVRDLLKQNRATAVFVTHDQEEAMAVGDRIAVMYDGVLQQVGTPEDIFHNPETQFVGKFMGQTDFIPARVTHEGLEAPFALVRQTVNLPVGTTVEIAVRPDDVAIEVDEEGIGTVLSREFVGIANIYSVGFADGTVVHSWANHTIHIPVNSSVRVLITQSHPLTCFHNGHRVR